MKFLKIGLSLVGVVLLLLVIGGAVFIATFDANQYKSLISEQVKQQTGRDFTLQEIKPSIFPWLGIELQQVSLRNAKGFSAKNMVQIQRLEVRVELLPLLSQDIRIDTLKIHGLELFLAKDKKGISNWDDILKKQASSSTPPSSVQTPAQNKEPEKTTDSPLAGLVVNGIELKTANIIWDDASTGKKIALQKLNLITGRLREGEALPIKLSTWIELADPAASMALELKTQLKFDMNAQTFKLAELILEVDAKLQQPELTNLQLALNTNLNMDLARQNFVMNSYSLKINLEGNAFANKKLAMLMDGSLAIDLKKQTAQIKPLTLKTQDLEINLDLRVKQLLDAPMATGQLVVEPFEPRKLAKSLLIDLPKTRSDKALKTAALNIDFVANEQSLELSSVNLKLDQSTLAAKVKIRHFDKPEITYLAKLDKMQLDDYLAPPVKPVKPVKQAPKASTSTPHKKPDIPIELPVEMLRSLNIKGSFEAKSLVVAEQQVSNLFIKTQAKSGVISLPDISATVLKGKVNASALLDVRKNTPKYQFDFQGQQLKAELIVNPILQNMLGEKSVSMSGDTNMQLNVKTRGQSVNQLMANSNGQFKMHMGLAELHGVDIEYFVRKGAVNYLQEKKLEVPQEWRGQYKPKETTALKVARASATIKQGVVENKDLLLEASRFTLTGAGQINFPKEMINYRVVVDVQQANVKTVPEQVLDVPMPVFVKGGFAQPDISIDWKRWRKGVNKALTAEAKKELKQKIKKQKNKEIDKLKNRFKGLFK